MKQSEIIEALCTLNEYNNPNESEITHHKGTDEMGEYEYFQYVEKSIRFSSPDLHTFVNSVIDRIRN
jgi:hypothetical protein|tara:strand:- start:304 stop:504 length:201 start_codon:yes stop_codon:yes gene_type:complete